MRAFIPCRVQPPDCAVTESGGDGWVNWGQRVPAILVVGPASLRSRTGWDILPFPTLALALRRNPGVHDKHRITRRHALCRDP